MSRRPPIKRTPPTTMKRCSALDPDRKTPRRGSIREKLSGEVIVHDGLKIGEKENRGAVVKKKPSEPRKEDPGG